MTSKDPQRRLAAILFTDIVGSTAATAQSQATGLALRDRHRALVRRQVVRYHGRFIEAPGDESLSTFESGLNAVNCALAIRKALGGSDLQLHMGLHLGEIAFRGEEVFGDGVNVAARVCSVSPAGEVYVSGALADALRGQEQIEASPRGEHKFKGVEGATTVYAVTGAPGEPAVVGPFSAQPGRSTAVWVAAAALVLLAVGVLAWWGFEPAPVEEPLASFGRPAIAVLPFDNLGGGREQSIFAGGLAEDLITRLASWRSFPVIARGSSTDPSLPRDVQGVGRELGARYVVEGSVREAGDLVRIVVQLIDATSGHHVWAEQYDRKFDDFLALQNEISEAIVGAMNPELLHSEMERSMRQDPESLNAWNAAMQGWWHFDQFTPQDMARARELFGRAVELDPQWGHAYAGLALSHFYELSFGWSDSPQRSAEEGRRAAEKAVALDELGAEGHHAMGHYFSVAGQTERMLNAFQEGVELNPSHHLANNCYGYHLAWVGRPHEAFEYIERAMSLSPRDPLAFAPRLAMSWAHFAAGDYAHALEWAERSIQRAPQVPFAYLVGAASAAHLGDVERAKRSLQEHAQVRGRPFPLEALQAGYRSATPDFRERLIDGLRKAGWEG